MKSIPRILVTGATGFVGGALVRMLVISETFDVVAPVRHSSVIGQRHLEMPVVESITPATDWQACLDGVDIVVHCAARVHVMHDTVTDSLGEFRRFNVAATLNLARQAATAGARRFVFISSVKVNGEESLLDYPFTPSNIPAPQDPYGVSKMEAEQALRDLAAQTGMEVVIIRPPLVYGPGVGANFDALIQAVGKGVPLPLGAIENKRSLVALDNLDDLIATCIHHPNAANQTFMVSDGESMSTPELIRRLANAMNRPARLFFLPCWLLRIGAKLTGKSSAMLRICGNLQVDISYTQNKLGWKPPVSVDEGLQRAVAQWRKP